MRLACLLLALVLTAGACSTSEPMMSDSSSDDATPRGEQSADDVPAQRVPLGEPFTIEHGTYVELADEDVEVRFDSVTSDSRCPANADCIRAGEAFAHFTLFEDGRAMPFKLEMPGMVMEMQDMERYQFQRVDRFVVALLLLQPYPELASETGMPTTATLEVRQLTR